MSSSLNKLRPLAEWFFWILLVFTALSKLGQGHILSSLIIMAASLLLITTIRNRFLQKINHRFSDGSLVLSSIIAIVLSFAFSGQSSTTQNTSDALLSPNPQPTTTQSQPSSKVAQKPKQSDVSKPTANLDNIACKVVSINDGDTLTCLTDTKSQVKVRLNQIDAPEKAQGFGNAAKQALSNYVFGKTVSLKTAGTDRYGRTLAEVYLDDKNINKAMVADGYAWAYREYMKDGEYATLEDSARSSTKGLWSEPSPIYPSDFRRGKRGEQTAPIQTQTITQQVEQKAVADSGDSCGLKLYCREMATCAEARHYLNDCGVSRLDRDGDGVPCESICR